MDDPAPGRVRPAPELLAGVVAAVIWVTLGVSLLASSGAAAPRSTPVPIATSAPTAQASATIEGGLVVLIRSSDARLAEQGRILDDLLAAESLDVPQVAAAVRQVNSTATFAIGILDRLAAEPGGEAIARPLRTAYEAVRSEAESILALALANESGYRSGATKLVKLIAALPDIDALLAATTPTPTPSDSPGSTATPAATSTSEATATPAATATPEPTATPIATPGPSMAGNLLVNPGFESGPAPWELVLGVGASGTFTVTGQGTASGSSAGEITLTGGSGPWSAASLRQGGLRLDNGTLYHVIVTARAAAPRDIRVRVTTPAGAVIASRILSIGTTWAPVGFDLTAIGTVIDARLVIETGVVDGTVWLDDLVVAP